MAFRSISEIVRQFNQEKVLLEDMFEKRTIEYNYNFARELVEYKEERIKRLIDNGVLRDNGDFLELEDIYLRFFEEVLQVNEDINVSYVGEYIAKINDNIQYYHEDNSEYRKLRYKQEIRRCLKTMALATYKNVIDLKRILDNTYKNEPNYKVKKAKLEKLDEKHASIKLLIEESERLIDEKQAAFFQVEQDVAMQNTVKDAKCLFSESYHHLIDIRQQIIHYLNTFKQQDNLLKKIRQIKYLRDQCIWKEYTDVTKQIAKINPIWLEPTPTYRTRLSLERLYADESLYVTIKDAQKKIQNKGLCIKRQLAGAIPQEFLDQKIARVDIVDLNAVKNAFLATSHDLYSFIMDYSYSQQVSHEDKLTFFCQIATQYIDELDITTQYKQLDGIEYALIYAKNTIRQ